MKQPLPLWAKITLGIGVLSLLCVVAIALAARWAVGRVGDSLVDLQSDLSTVEADARAFAAANPQPACVSAGKEKVLTCTRIDLNCQVGAAYFTSTCLSAAPPDPQTCAALPAAAAERPAYALHECAAADPDQSSMCVSFILQTVGRYCPALD